MYTIYCTCHGNDLRYCNFKISRPQYNIHVSVIFKYTLQVSNKLYYPSAVASLRAVHYCDPFRVSSIMFTFKNQLSVWT